MALTDSEKLYIVRLKFQHKLNSFETWDDFKAFLENVTKTQVKNFIVNALSEQQTEDTARSDDLEVMVTDFEDLKTEIDVL